MKILLVHNFYREPGGEDVVFSQERSLLERMGHQVLTYTRSNEETVGAPLSERLRLLRTIVSAPDSRNDVARLLQAERPDVVHIHNTFMMISPSIYQACSDARIPTVQTLHNYRLLCPATTLYRSGTVCEECVDHGLTRSVRYGCYRESRATTASVAVMLKVHRVQGTWSKQVNAFIALTDFAKQKFSENGLPAQRIHVKPNFIDPDPGEHNKPRNHVLFAGRLTEEKGVATLLAAWSKLALPTKLIIAGDGPARPALEQTARSEGLNHVEFLGRCSRDRIRDLMETAHFLVIPSLWYEGFPMVLVESFACSTPVIGSRLGAMQEIIRDGDTGLHFRVGNAGDLTHKLTWALEHLPEMKTMGEQARLAYLEKYSASSNYDALMRIYSNAIATPLD